MEVTKYLECVFIKINAYWNFQKHLRSLTRENYPLTLSADLLSQQPNKLCTSNMWEYILILVWPA